MLILTRRVRETLCIGDDVRVTVLGVKGDQVRIGIEAPKTIPVHRKEIYEKIRKENEADNATVEHVDEEQTGDDGDDSSADTTHLSGQSLNNDE